MDLDRSADCRISAWGALLVGWWLCAACSDATVTVGKLGVPSSGRASPTGDAGFVSLDASSSHGAAGSRTGSSGSRTDSAVYRVSIELGSRDDVCRGKGPMLVGKREGAAATDCAWRVERRVFRYGLCACEELRLDADAFLLDSFDSSPGKYQASQTGGSIGVNGAITQLAGNTQVLGNLISAGAVDLTLSGKSLFVSGDFKQQAALRLDAGGVRVGRDLWLASDASAGQGSLQVERDAYQASGRSGLGSSNVTGRVITGDVLVPAPCDCSASPVIDVPALVAQAKNTNDNAAAGFSPDALNLQMYVTDWNPLPCGRLYLTQIALQGLNTYVLIPIGRTAIFVQGDLRVSALSTLVVSTDPVSGGELDIFVAGNVIVEANSSLIVGNNARPSATRMYVGGQIRMLGNLALGGQLYAPQATLELSAAHATVEQYGSIFARNVRLPTQRMHYDRAILRAGAPCAAPAPQACDGENQCPDDLACMAGSCGACLRDADCCDPAVCSSGKCQALVSDWP